MGTAELPDGSFHVVSFSVNITCSCVVSTALFSSGLESLNQAMVAAGRPPLAVQ